MKPRWANSLVVLFLLLGFCSHAPEEPKSVWKKIDTGLHYAEFKAPEKSELGDSKILVVRADPKEYDLVLLSASERPDGQSMTVKEWSGKFGLIAAINAGMFQKDRKSNVGYMKNRAHRNNPRINRRYFSVLAFNPREEGLAPVRIFDTDEDPIKDVIAKYDTVIQNLRLIKRPGINRWARQDKKWSEAALGQDKDGNLLFVFSESPYSMKDFGDFLLQLPLNLECAQHLEGGVQASFYLNHNKTELTGAGRQRTSSVLTNPNGMLFPIPNVIGLKKKG